MKRVLVTGASGSLGATVVTTLAERGYTVIAARRALQSLPSLENIQAIPLDLASEKGWGQLPQNIDAVVHCAAYIPTHYSNEPLEADRLWTTNSLGTLKLLIWAKANGVTKFIYCSSHSVYQRPAPCPIDEDHLTHPSGHTASYAVSKLAGEIFVTSMQSDNFHVCCLRLSSLYGSRMKKSGVVAHFIDQVSLGKALTIETHPDSSFDLLYVQDAASAIHLCLMNLPKRTIYNIGAGVGTTLIQLATACWESFGSSAASPNISMKFKDITPVHSVLDIVRAQRDLDYHPTFDIRSGLQDMKAKM